MNLLNKIAQQRATPPAAPAGRLLGARYRRILFFFARVIIELLWWEWLLPRVGLHGRVERTRPARLRRIAARFRALATRMGGVMIKVGQFLSARFDVLPPEIVAELAGLQDEVPAEDFVKVRALAETELGARLEEAFASFEPIPLAAASLGQVHRATLHPAAGIPTVTSGGASTDSGPIINVVVKIQRPGIERAVETDLAALRQVGGWARRYPELRKRANIPALLDEFATTTRAELDYLAEGHNAETLAHNLAKRPGICLPKVDWKHTTVRVLTLEDVYAIKINDYAAITAAGIDRAAVAHRLFQSYLQQIFEDGFFHADPHPGNLFVQRLADDVSGGGSAGWQLTFVDFGMVGQVSPALRANLRELAIALVARDTRRLVQTTQDMGMLLPGADLALLEQAESRLFALFGGKSMTELHKVDREQVQQLFDEFGELMYAMPFQIPNNLLFLGRCLAILSGICSGLDPAFDMWKELEPFAQKLVAAEALPVGRQLLGQVGKIASTLAALPGKVDRVLDQADRGGLSARTPDLSRQVQRLEQSLNRLWGAVVFAALLLGSVQLEMGGRREFAIVLLVGAGFALLWLIWPRRRFG